MPPSLIERDLELQEMERTVTRVAAGAPALLVIEGPPGIGKTALLEAAAGLAARRGLRTLRARGRVLEQDLAWSLTRQLLGGAVRGATPTERRRLLSGAARLARPVLGLVEGHYEQRDPSEALYGLFWLTLNLAENQPLLLAVDDVQWADAQSLSFLSYLCNRLDEAPILLAAVRREGQTHIRSEPLEALHSTPSPVTLRPEALSEEGTAQLTERLLSQGAASQLGAAIHRATDGNPFLVQELCRDLMQRTRSGGEASLDLVGTRTPANVSRSVLERLAQVPGPAEEVAGAVAVLGPNATMRTVSQLTGRAPADVADTTALLAGADILRAGAEVLEFAHPLVGQAVYEGMPPARRGVLHGQAARLLADDGCPVGEVASQLLAAAPAGESWRVQALRQAAQAARNDGAPETASACLRRALVEPAGEVRRAVLLELGSTELQHDPQAAVEQFEQAHRLAQSARDRAAVAQLLSRAHALLSDFRVAISILSDSIDELGDEDDELRRRLNSARLAYARWDYGSQGLRETLFDDLRRRAGNDRPLDPYESANLAHELAARGQDLETAAAHARAAIDAAPALRGTDASWILQLSSVLALCDRVDEAETVLLAAVRDAQCRGSEVDASAALTLATYCSLRRGAVVETIDRAEASLALASGVWGLGAVAWLVEALAEHDEARRAMALLVSHGLEHEPGSLEDGRPLGYQDAVLIHHRARARALAGESEQALRDFRQVGELAEGWGVRNPVVLDWRSAAARLLLAGGRRDEAQELAHEELELARIWGSDSAVGVALRTVGECEPGAEGTALLREATEFLARSPARLDQARALTSLGARLRRERRQLEAREILRQALDLSTVCGALLVANRARDELIAAGGRPRRDALRGRDALTGRELRVAELALEGRTNRQIAQALFLSPRTVEHHLRNAYRKLDIQSREELARALAAAGPS